MEQHPVPQHIASFQFKLFGNLTVRQFITLAIPMSLAAAIYFSGLPALVRLPLALVVGLFALFAALVPIGGRPFDKWVVAFIKAIMSPTRRIWIKEAKIPEFLNVVTAPSATEEHIPESITAQGRARLRQYLRSLPKGEITPLDVKEQIAVSRLDLETSVSSEGLPKLPPPIIWPTQKPYSPTSLPQINVAPKVSMARQPATEAPPDFELTKSSWAGALEASLPPISPASPTTRSDARRERGEPARVALHAKPFALPGLERKLQKEQGPLVELSPAPPLVKTKLASEINASIENVIPIRTADKQIKFIHGIGKTRVRKLHFAPPANFDLSKLPIRGEKRFEISEELKKRYQSAESLFDKADKPGLELPYKPASPIHHPLQPPQSITQNVPHAPRSIPKPQKTTFAPGDVFLKKEPVTQMDSRIKIWGQKSPNTSPQVLSPAQIVPLTHKPNVISGIVTASNKTSIENAILVVKDAAGIPLRALKTNKLGQFLSATPLSNGTYTIEVESDLQKFAPLTLNLSGQVLSPLEITAKSDANRLSD